MSAFASLVPLVASIRSALEQPLFPGKVVMWLLIMLSIVSWVMILSKALQLRRAKRSDERFAHRLKRSRNPLEVFEEGWEEEDSLRHLIYSAGAREVAFQLLGSCEPAAGVQDRAGEMEGLSGRQAERLRQAFRAGFRAARTRLASGVAILRLVAMAALFLGLAGFLWTLMTGLDAAAQSRQVVAAVGSALGFAVVGLLVAGPPFLARIAFAIHERNRRRELSQFQHEIARLFERRFRREGEAGGARSDHASPRPTDSPSAAGSTANHLPPPEADDTGSSGDDEKRRYISIRERLLRPEAEDAGTSEESEEAPINPIALQANSVHVH